MTVVMIAALHNGPSRTMPAMAARVGTRNDTGVTRAGGTVGNFHIFTAPRSGRRSPRNTMVRMMMTNGIPSRAPYSGNHEMSFCSFVQSDWPMPMSTPVTTVGPKFWNFPMRAAPRAGTRNPNV